MSEWISVKDRLPSDFILCVTSGSMILSPDLRYPLWTDDERGYYFEDYITHWMPLPPAPEEPRE